MDSHALARTLNAMSSLLAATALVAGCGGGNDSVGVRDNDGSGGGSWRPGVFLDASTFQNRCAVPRSGNDPDGFPWPDVRGTVIDENNFLRSYSFDTYLWYDEIVDRDPATFTNPISYFNVLRTFATTPSGSDKDQFHFTYDTDEWIALSESGISGGYGAQFAILNGSPPREIVVAYTDPNTPAANNGLVRGTEIIQIDDQLVVNGNSETLINGLFPESPGEIHTFRVRDPGGSERSFSMTSGLFASQPVLRVDEIPTPTGSVGYILFNDHIATAEEQLYDAISQLDAAAVTDLVLDLRYNGGGFLAIASQLAYMIAGQAQTGGRVFELQQFNDKYPSTNPVTGAALQPIPFYSTSAGFFSLPANVSLPSLDLQRVFVITGNDTCSASEAIINGLRGAGVEVIQIGSTTCGKPYGFYPTDNCGTTYFTIQFRGVNDQGFGDYADGFTPSPTGGSAGAVVRGCPVGDDFSAALGDPSEARLATALAYHETGACPAQQTISGIPATGRLRLGPEQPIRVPKEPWRENRILERP